MTRRDEIAKWVAFASGHTPTSDEARCLEALCVIATGPHNIHPIGGWRGPGVWWGGKAVSLTLRNVDFATTDCDELTRIVIAAHRLAVRVSVSAVLVGFDLIGGRDGSEPEDYTPTIRPYETGADVEPEHDYWGAGLELMAHAREVSHPAKSGMVTHPTLARLAHRIGGAS